MSTARGADRELAAGGAGGERGAERHAGAPDLDQEILREFVLEAKEQLADADARLLELERDPRHDEALNAVFRTFHTIKGLAGFLNLEDLQSTAHAAEDLLDCARDRKLELRGPAFDLVFQSSDVLQHLIQQIGECLSAGAWPPAGLARAAALVAAIRELVAAARSPAVEPTQPPAPAANEERGAPDGSGRRRQAEGAERTLRVDADRLDHLVDLVGELVITESMVTRAAAGGADRTRELRRHMLRLDKITRELQELSGSLRMVPVQGLFRKMARLARDTAKKCGKEVSFETTGEDTELDKTVVEKVADPLVHLIRNAIDHGLESDPAERLRHGKPGAGRVQLRAFHKGGSIFIEVEDDGRGLNRAAIIEKAVQRGLIQRDEVLDERDIYSLICQPGFSTAAKITALSGRGVGMDVVKRNIVSMGGALEIRSEAGKGTCFAMKLPLTLAVIDGMLVRAGAQRYVVPTLSVVRLVEPRRSDVTRVMDRDDWLQVQGQPVPLVRLTTLFRLAPARAEPRLALVLESDGERIAVVVDELLGQQQAVIKSIGSGIGETPGVSGCAILSDGRVGLVIDVAGLLSLAKGERGAAAGHPAPRGLDEKPNGAWTA